VPGAEAKANRKFCRVLKNERKQFNVMKRIFYSLLFAGTVWTAASQNPPEIKTPDRKAAERIEEYYLSKMLPDSM